MNYLSTIINKYLGWISVPNFRVTDILEIIILAFVIYKIMAWIKNTKAWMLLRGIILILVFIVLAAILKMDAILWLATKLVSVIAIAAVVIFQPEIRRALERLGERSFLANLFPDSRKERESFMSEHTIVEIVKSCSDMAKAKTGALIVVEQLTKLSEFERTGINLDSVVSRQLILNIFEHNTPLHDGAIIVRGNRIVAATCYLPLSDSTQLDKELGTRHRAAVGMSEVSDATVIVVSEETGRISYAVNGKLTTDITPEELKKNLTDLQGQTTVRRGFLSRLLLGKETYEAEDIE